MRKKLKVTISLMVSIALIVISIPLFADENQVLSFTDVPEGHWAYEVVHDLRELKITDGIGNNRYGMGMEIKRSEFVAFLVRLMRWELINPETGSFIDNTDITKWYYQYIETALNNNVIFRNSSSFRPNDPITREEMAIMIVNSLGYDILAKQLADYGSDFDDVTENTGYITIARDFGIITGVGGNKFMPYSNAKREHAAAMMMRMYNKINMPLNELHAFYAIRSYPQMDKITALSSVSFGWSSLEYNPIDNQVILNMTSSNKNDFFVPSGDFSEPVRFAQDNNVSTQLMVFADNNTMTSIGEDSKTPLLENILTQSELRNQAISSIIYQLNETIKDDITISFDGVVIDFESMKGELLKESFNLFLEELKQELDKWDKKLYVAVHPKRRLGQEHYDGYDYNFIGEIADKVILMAHDYYAKILTDSEMQSGYTITPLTPFDEIYFALKTITDKTTGVNDVSKIWLQLSFDSVQWKLQDGQIINKEPNRPSYKDIQHKLITDIVIDYSNLNQNPFVKFFDSTDQTDNVLWYEDSRSIEAKIKLARMFGVNGISLWRLGIIPNCEDPDEKSLYLDIWQYIMEEIKKS